jgi:hypothetical protein
MRSCPLFILVRIPRRLFAPLAPSVAPKGGAFTAPESGFGELANIHRRSDRTPLPPSLITEIIPRMFHVPDLAGEVSRRLGSVRTALGVIPDACINRRGMSGDMPLAPRPG